MSDVTKLNLAPCNIKENIKENILANPPQCSSMRALKYKDTHTVFKGPFKNMSSLKIDNSKVPKTPSNVLQTLSQKEIPKEWSWYEKGGNKIENGNRNQGSCGCCWAMALVSALGDRYAIKYNIASPLLSAFQLVSCGGPEIGKHGEYGSTKANKQCLCGGSCYAGGLWLEQGGSVGLDECWPYSLMASPSNCDTDSGNQCNLVASNCPDFNSDCCAGCCGNPASKPKFTVKKNSTKYVVVADENNIIDIDSTIKAIQIDIMGKGPITATFWVPPDFQDWWSSGGAGSKEIYIPKKAPTIGSNGHTVVLTGWGEDKGVKFWEMRNTWGSPGYCRFAMSTSTPKDLWTGLDIPFFSQNSWLGGCITMEPGKLTDYSWVKGKGDFPVGDGWVTDSSDKISNINWKLISKVLGLVLIILIFVAIIS
jgi:hypothetical protein